MVNDRLGRVMATVNHCCEYFLASICQCLVGKLLTVQAPLLAQEADFAVRVTPDQTDNDRLFLASLETIYTP